MSDEQNVATAADFRALAEAEAYDPPERIVLPKCGLAVIVQRPRPLAYLLSDVSLPQGLAAKLAAADEPEKAPLTAEEKMALLERQAKVFMSCFVSPKFSLDPGADEVSPSWLPAEDQKFLTRYLGGEIDATGADLATFSESQA